MNKGYIEFNIGGCNGRLLHNGDLYAEARDEFGNRFWRRVEDENERRNALVGLYDSISAGRTRQGSIESLDPLSAQAFLGKGLGR